MIAAISRVPASSPMAVGRSPRPERRAPTSARGPEMRLILVRHGRPDEDDVARPHDPPLHEDGWRQARAVAALLAREGVSRIIASPLMRARQTAEPLAERLDMPIGIVEGWVEADRHVARYRSMETLRAQGDEEWKRFLGDPIRYLGGDPAVFRAEVL